MNLQLMGTSMWLRAVLSDSDECAAAESEESIVDETVNTSPVKNRTTEEQVSKSCDT